MGALCLHAKACLGKKIKGGQGQNPKVFNVVYFSTFTETQKMRYWLLHILILFSIRANAQKLKPGDNIVLEYKKMSQPHFSDGPKMTEWVEANGLLFIGSKLNLSECDFVFIALPDTTIIGGLNLMPKPVFVFDMDGDSKLDVTTDFFLLPGWAVKRKMRAQPSDKSVLVLLDKVYNQTLQADEGGMDEKTRIGYQQYMTDTTLPNRYIMYLFDCYQTIVNDTHSANKPPSSDICIRIMHTLAGECIAVYDEIPVIVCILMGEALNSAGMIIEAREHFKKGLRVYPNSIPLQVYNYKLEANKGKRDAMLNRLRKNHPDHWMVKNL